jgi:coproporphyrinogen III oxidase-like Fe-S oxidoreductase
MKQNRNKKLFKNLLIAIAGIAPLYCIGVENKDATSLYGINNSAVSSLTNQSSRNEQNLKQWVNYYHITGKKWTESKTPRQNEVNELFVKKTLPLSLKKSKLRIIKPGMIITMEYSPERINIEIDNHQKIIKVYFG